MIIKIKGKITKETSSAWKLGDTGVVTPLPEGYKIDLPGVDGKGSINMVVKELSSVTWNENQFIIFREKQESIEFINDQL